MYLKKLSLKGFKSFPIKTDIFFEQGITAIVGPNGSGKSNISDAIRWVLGEQSIKSLRGEKMEDVIFSGTDTKKQLNYCEVSLTLDNELGEIDIDSNELVIKRRAYRTGESEYFINGKVCRLRDVKETLMDTGIGKDGYSIIEQGKVEEILSSNPVNRRKVFDEACGISKYRYRKNEAEKNLKKSSENLSRIVDIFSEIENQLGPLERQQEKAKKYLNISKELKKYEINDIINQNNEIENSINDLNFQLKEVSKEINVIDREKEALETEIFDLEKDANSIECHIENMNLELMELNNLINNNTTEAEINIEKKKNLNHEIERKKSEVNLINKKLELARKELNKANDRSNQNSYVVEAFEKEIDEIYEKKRKSELNLENVNREIDKTKTHSLEFLKKREEISNSVTKITANIENMNSKKDEMENRISELEENIKSLNEEMESKRSKEKSLEIEFEEQIKIINEGNKKIENVNRDIFKFSEKHQKKNISIGSLNAKRNTYIDMENHHEGFNKGVKEILKNRNIKGIHGAFGEIIKVPKVYEKSIEASLGAAIQNVVVENENIAKQSIAYLKKNNLGRVTFLPMNIINGTKFTTNTMKSSVRPVGIASDLIEFDEKYRSIVDSLLGRVVVIDNIDNAVVFANDTSHKYKIVTLEGDILNPGGSMTGGSLRTGGNILSRKRIIDELEREINTTQKSLLDMQIKIEDLKKIKEKLKNNREIANLKKAEIEREKVTISTELKMLLTEAEKSKKNLFENKSLIEDLEEEIEKSSIALYIHKKKIVELSNANKDNDISINKLLEKQKKLSDENELYVKMFNDKNVELARQKQIFENNILEVERIAKDIEESEKNIKNIESTSDDDQREIKVITELIEKFRMDVKVQKENYDKISNEILEKKQSKDSIRKKFDEKKAHLRNIERRAMEISEEKFKLNSKLERNKGTKDNLLSNLYDKYELTYVQALEYKDTTIKIDRKRIEKLRRAIKELGNVNIDSIKEYEEVKSRHDYYKEQKEDLEKSIISLNDLIDDLVENMEKEFIEKFNIINKNFKNVYQKLFGGGNANLKLSDPNNVLSCDIDITAQPPGKKMKNLSLLSGGEKALTAICILFSILISKPTPFCILDEIEAPLDDVNVYRFGEYLKELSSETQFIAVTHRRGTMEVADFIYGVTMQEKGVSSVISIKLKEATEIIDK